MKFFPSESQRGGAGRSRALGRGLSCPCSCPEPTMRAHFVCIHFCLPAGTPAPCEGGVSRLLLSPGWEICHPAFPFHLCSRKRPLGLNRTPLLPSPSQPSPTPCPNTAPLLPTCRCDVPREQKGGQILLPGWQCDTLSHPGGSGSPGKPYEAVWCPRAKLLTKVLLMNKQKVGMTLFSPGRR